MRTRPWVAICLCLSGLALVTSARAQYQESFVARAARAQQQAEMPLKVIEIIEEFENTTTLVLDRYAAMGAGQSLPPLSDDEISRWVIQPRIDAVQQLARDLPAVKTTPIPAFNGGAGLAPLERRRVMRARVMELIHRQDELDEGRDLMEQYRQMDLALGQLSSSLHSAGDELMPLFALQTVPAPLPDFVRRVGYVPLDLISTYPEAILRSQVGLQGKTNNGNEILRAGQAKLASAVAEAQGQLTGERSALNAIKARVDALQARADLTEQHLRDAEEQRRLAAGRVRQAESDMADADRQVLQLQAAVANSENFLKIVQERIDRSLVATQAAYNWCPQHQPWEQCNHAAIKADWLARSTHQTAVDYRSYLSESKGTRDVLQARRSELNQARARARSAREALPTLREYLQRWDTQLPQLRTAQATALSELKAERERTRVDLLLDAISHDESALRSLGSAP